MEAVAAVATPVFSVILIGYLAGRARFFEDFATDALNRFVFNFALPALLFSAMFKAPLAQILDPMFLLVYCAPLAVVLLIAVLVGLGPLKRPPADLAMEAGAAAYGNVGYMGVPLVLMAFGEQALPQVVAAVVVTGSVLLAGTIMVVEAQLNRDQGSRWAVTLKMGRSLARNPVLAAPVIGGVLASLGLIPPTGVRGIAELLGGAAAPCALFTLGLQLARQSLRGQWGGVAWLVALKMLAAPALTWLLAYRLLPVEPSLARAALLLNALPCGAGAFIVAQNYQLRTAQISGAVLASTMLSLGSVALLLALFAAGAL